jgi:DNA topoisomerase-2
MMDGLKISQRKIIFCCFKRNLTDKEIKVAQLAAYVSEHSAYHHGEASLQSTIVGMAQDFVGANNINLLKPNGQFGTRQMGGQDAGQPRYIYTLLSNLCTKIFIKEDQNVLTYLTDDDLNIEPEHYIPIIPMILVNGALGIGTGFSTNIPCYNPRDIIGLLKRIMDGEDISEVEMIPWYNGFNGSIEKINGKYFSRGRFAKASATKIEVTELPIGTWTFDFKCLLENIIDKFPDDVKGYENNSSTVNIKFMINFTSSEVVDKYLRVESNGLTKFENDFKLSTSKPLGITNMYAFNSKGTIQKFNTPIDIIINFYQVRLEYYQKRKDYLTSKLKYDLDILRNKIRFIKAVVNEEIIIHKLKKADLEIRLEKDEYMKHEGVYDYITRIPVYNLTIDKVEDLEADVKKADLKYDDLMAKEITDMWKDELDILSHELDKHIKTSTAKITIKKKLIIKE